MGKFTTILITVHTIIVAKDQPREIQLLIMTLRTDIAITPITPVTDTCPDALQLSPLQAQTPWTSPR